MNPRHLYMYDVQYRIVKIAIHTVTCMCDKTMDQFLSAKRYMYS